jgi:hypothetical protein
MLRCGFRGSSAGAGGKVKARLSDGPETPGSTAGRGALGSSSEKTLPAGCGAAEAMTGAVVVGAVDWSIDATLDMDVGLVCIVSLAAGPGSGISIFCAILATGSLN